jgi:hypothetical protein
MLKAKCRFVAFSLTSAVGPSRQLAQCCDMAGAGVEPEVLTSGADRRD